MKYFKMRLFKTSLGVRVFRLTWPTWKSVGPFYDIAFDEMRDQLRVTGRIFEISHAKGEGVRVHFLKWDEAL